MRTLLRICALLAVLIAILALLNINTLKRLKRVNTLFDKENIVENFQDADILFDVSRLEASTHPHVLPTNIGNPFPKTFQSKGKTYDVQEFLKSTRTEGLLVIQNDTIIYEQYFLGLEPSESHISWSMSKSAVSALVGIAVEQGLLSETDIVSSHLPEFMGTGYEQVSVADLLQMSSGVQFVEDYSDFNSDINRFGRTFAMGSSFKEFALSLKNEKAPGTFNHYVSIDTQVLGLLLHKVTGKSLTILLYDWIWEPVGMEHPAQWIIDDTGFEMALGGLNASLRDYAKLGLLYLHEGKRDDQQIVPAGWVKKSTTPHAPHLMPNQTENSSSLYGYGYQWWIPQFPEDDFFASGIYDQFVYVNRKKNLVIAKLSADHNFKTMHHEIKAQHVDFFQAMAKGM